MYVCFIGTGPPCSSKSLLPHSLSTPPSAALRKNEVKALGRSNAIWDGKDSNFYGSAGYEFSSYPIWSPAGKTVSEVWASLTMEQEKPSTALAVSYKVWYVLVLF